LSKLSVVRGPVFLGVTIAVVLWLWASGNLSLYIHPRYNVFTVTMAIIALIGLGLWAAIRLQRDTAETHSHEGHDHSERPRLAERTSSVVGILALLALVGLPPATLSTQTVENRSLNQSGLGDAGAVFEEAASGVSGTYAAFSVREWAAILSQTSDPAFYSGKPAQVVGFVSEDPDDPDQFYLTRFVVSCCSVDAQPVGIPVRLPGWRDTYSPEDWLSVSGQFVLNPSSASPEPIVLSPDAVEPTEQPDDPYLF